MNVRMFALAIFYFSLALAVIGMLVQSIEVMAAGTLGASIGYALKDYFSSKTDSVDPMTVSAIFFGAWVGLGHLAGHYYLNTEYEATFYAYSVMEFILPAQTLATIAVLVPLFAYPWFKRFVSGPSAVLPALPKVGFEVSDRTALIFCLALLAIGWVNNLDAASLGIFGTLNAFLSRGSEIAIFLLAWHWFGPKPTFPAWTKWLLFGAVIGDVIYSLMFSYMRGEVAYPLLMISLALLMRKAVTKKHIAVVVVILPVFAFVYRGIGELRGYGVYGTERVSRLAEQLPGRGGSKESSAEEEEGMEGALLSLVARNCLFAQLSQISRIADEDGFYNGETLEYMTYAFIPRMIWPEKPLITPGQWFAERIGRGMRLSDTKFSNAINMSLAGEFYLNFGWLGAVLGVVVMTFLYAILWKTTGFYNPGNNPIGQTLGIGILFQATASSSAAGILNLIFIYLAMLAVSISLIFIKRRRNRLARMQQKPSIVHVARNARF